jgi:hypothetical protein
MTPFGHLRHLIAQWRVAGRPHIIRLHAGDIITIAIPGAYGEAYVHELTARLEDVFGHRHEIVILDAGTTLSVVRPGQL